MSQPSLFVFDTLEVPLTRAIRIAPATRPRFDSDPNSFIQWKPSLFSHRYQYIHDVVKTNSFDELDALTSRLRSDCHDLQSQGLPLVTFNATWDQIVSELQQLAFVSGDTEREGWQREWERLPESTPTSVYFWSKYMACRVHNTGLDTDQYFALHHDILERIDKQSALSLILSTISGVVLVDPVTGPGSMLTSSASRGRISNFAGPFTTRLNAYLDHAVSMMSKSSELLYAELARSAMARAHSITYDPATMHPLLSSYETSYGGIAITCRLIQSFRGVALHQPDDRVQTLL